MRMGLQNRFAAVFFMAVGLLITGTLHAANIKSQNLKQLVDASESIISGQVVSVTDGFDDNKRPYTEVTIKVGGDAKGKHEEGSTFTFRQFGLLKPRSMGNGKIYLGVSPEGFAKWREGEQVIAFMYKPASITGFQTTAGMAQGKFVVRNGKATNDFANYGLWNEMDTSAFTTEETNMLTAGDAVDAAVFMGLVGKLAGASE